MVVCMIKKLLMIIAMLGVVGFIHAEDIPYWIEDTGSGYNLWVKVSIPAGGSILLNISKGGGSPDGTKVFDIFYWTGTEMANDGNVIGYPNKDTQNVEETGDILLGGYDHYGKDAYVQINKNLPNNHYLISFRYYFIDSWDSEYARMFVNGNQEWSFCHQVYKVESGLTALSTNIGNTDEWWWGPDCYGDFSVQYDGSILSIKWDSTLDTDAYDESWGLCRVIVRKYANPEPTVTQVESGSGWVVVNITNPNSEDLADFQVMIPNSDLKDADSKNLITQKDEPLTITDITNGNNNENNNGGGGGTTTKTPIPLPVIILALISIPIIALRKINS